MRPRILLLLVVSVFAAVSFCFTGHPEAAWPLAQLDDYMLNILLMAGINIILAVSLNMVNGYTGQFSLGHAGFMAVGAYGSAFITQIQGRALSESLGFLGSATPVALFCLALFVGGGLSALAGLAVGLPSLRLKGDYLAIVTLGFGEIIRVLIQNTEALGGARGLTGIPPRTTLGWTWGIAALSIYCVSSLVRSTYGRGFLAVRDDEIAAEAMGINSTRYKVTAFVVASFFAGLAGALYAHMICYISPEGFSFMKSVDVVVMVILGGMGSTTGVTLAAVGLTFLNEVLRQIQEYRMVAFSLLLIVLMISRPQGLIADLARFLPGKRRFGP
jgi:branched-chain amino acid transport system permease protein